MNNPDPFEPLHTAAGPAEAALVMSVLQGQGFDVHQFTDGAGAALGLQGGLFGNVDIYVRASQLDEARAAIDALLKD